MITIFYENILALQDSFQIISLNWKFFFYLVLSQCMFGALIHPALKNFSKDKDAVFVLSFCGGILILNLIYVLTTWLKIKPSAVLGWSLFVLLVVAVLWRWKEWLVRPSFSIIAFTTFFFSLLLFHLIFIQELFVPSYSDGVQHAFIVNDLLHPDRPAQAFYSISPDFSHYYHIGFDALAAWLSEIVGTKSPYTILLLGQYFQTLAVLSLYPLARILLKTPQAAWGTLLIAGLLLPVPAYASNWAKYPAISSLVGITFCLSTYCLILKQLQANKWKTWLVFGIFVFSTFTLHSRTLIVLLLCLLLINIFRKIKWVENFSLDGIPEHMLFLAIGLLAMLLGFRIADQEILIGFYISLFLCSFTAFYANFRLTASLLTSIIGLSLLGIVHFPPIVLGKSMSLIDAPFFSIVLFLPASIIFWLSIEGVIKIFTRVDTIHFVILTKIMIVCLLIIGTLNMFLIQEHIPSKCCTFVNDDDVFSYEWIKMNVPANTFVGIAATGEPGNYAPSDGGAWIDYFTSIHTRRLIFNTDFVKEKELLCDRQITYFYVDNLDNSFDEYDVFTMGAKYQFGVGGVRIYKLDCE